MSDSLNIPGSVPFRVDLDQDIVTLPGRSLESMLGMFAHLESIAIRRANNMVLSRKTAFNSPKPSSALPKFQAFEEGAPERISFRELGRQVISAAQGQVKVLQARAQELHSLVLINNWQVAERLWADLLPDCKTPLFELNFLEELWGIKPDQLEVGGWTLVRHWQQFILIQAEVEVLLARRQSLMHLSDILEGHLGLWLKRFEDILNKLDEQSCS